MEKMLIVYCCARTKAQINPARQLTLVVSVHRSSRPVPLRHPAADRRSPASALAAPNLDLTLQPGLHALIAETLVSERPLPRSLHQALLRRRTQRQPPLAEKAWTD